MVEQNCPTNAQGGEGGATQVPFWHIWVEPQAFPQKPQLLGSVLVLTQLPLQLVRPALQVMPQAPPEQVAEPLAGVGQTVPQLPQLLVSVLVLAQAPPQHV